MLLEFWKIRYIWYLSEIGIRVILIFEDKVVYKENFANCEPEGKIAIFSSFTADAGFTLLAHKACYRAEIDG